MSNNSIRPRGRTLLGATPPGQCGPRRVNANETAAFLKLQHY